MGKTFERGKGNARLLSKVFREGGMCLYVMDTDGGKSVMDGSIPPRLETEGS